MKQGRLTHITDNAAVLLPVLNPEAAMDGTTKSEMFVVMYGLTPAITACVVYGQASKKKKTELVFGDCSSTHMNALKKLLTVTMQLVQTHVFDPKNIEQGHAVSIAGGGYMIKDSSPNPEDHKFRLDSATLQAMSGDKPSASTKSTLSDESTRTNAGNDPDTVNARRGRKIALKRSFREGYAPNIVPGPVGAGKANDGGNGTRRDQCPTSSASRNGDYANGKGSGCGLGLNSSSGKGYPSNIIPVPVCADKTDSGGYGVRRDQPPTSSTPRNGIYVNSTGPNVGFSGFSGGPEFDDPNELYSSAWLNRTFFNGAGSNVSLGSFPGGPTYGAGRHASGAGPSVSRSGLSSGSMYRAGPNANGAGPNASFSGFSGEPMYDSADLLYSSNDGNAKVSVMNLLPRALKCALTRQENNDS